MRSYILLAYPVIGLVLGLADPDLGRVAQQFGVRPGVATAISVNLLLPLAAVGLACVHARVRTAWLGAAGLTIGLIAGLAVRYSAVINQPISNMLAAIPPVLVVAMFGYAALGTVAAVMARRRPVHASSF